MIRPERLHSAGEFVETLRLAVHDKTLPATQRIRASAPCLGIAQDHHHAIVFLIENRLYASAFSLLRLAFEAYLRGEWLALCAQEREINKFLQGWEPPSPGELLKQLEARSEFSEKILSRVKKKYWNAMCDYTHTGGLHIQRWITSESIEPNYSDDEVLEVLSFAEIIGLLSAIGFATLTNDEELANKVFDAFKNILPDESK